MSFILFMTLFFSTSHRGISSGNSAYSMEQVKASWLATIQQKKKLQLQIIQWNEKLGKNKAETGETHQQNDVQNFWCNTINKKITILQLQ